jgi:hypothetical protein
MEPSQGSSSSPVVVFYHRPIEDPFHGGSLHCNSFVASLRQMFPVEVIAPDLPPKQESYKTNRSEVGWAGFRYLISTMLRTAQFAVKEFTRGSNDRSRVLIAFGYTMAGFAALWAAIRRIRFVYYPQDDTREVSRSWQRSGQKGAHLLRWFVWPIEKLAMNRADLILVPSDAMRDHCLRDGFPESRLQVYMMQRRMPVLDASRVAYWRDTLGLATKAGVIFVGSFQYAPNIRSFEWVRSQLAPKLLSKAPDVQLLVAGLDSESFAVDLPPNLRVIGTVRDLDGLLYACTVGIAPMDTPGGTSGKIVDYALHGLKIVATPEAAEGVPKLASMVLASMEQFPEVLISVLSALGPSRAPPTQPDVDPTYVERYTNSRDATLFSDKIRDWIRIPGKLPT